MSVSGINFFYRNMSLPASGFKVLYDFSTSGVNIPSVSGANPQYTGVASSYIKTGLFNSGQSVNIPHSDEIRSRNWMMMCVFEKMDKSDAVLFSNFHETIDQSGFIFGVNAANKLYFEAADVNGPVLFEPDFDLATRNAVSMAKFGNRLEFSYFDFNAKKTTTDNFQISPSTNLISDDWYLARAVNPPAYVNATSFTGKMDYFVYITGSVFPPQQLALFSGLTLSTSPTQYVGLLNQNCAYSYLGLTGTISDVTFETIEAAIYCVQTGYLYNNVGQLVGNITGAVANGTGIASGYISGQMVVTSGYEIANTGFASGLIGYEEIGQGLRVFQSTVPSGVTGYFVPFPNSVSNPVVLTELEDAALISKHQISQVSDTGFYVSFSRTIPSNNYILTAMTASAQTNEALKFFKTDIPVDSKNYYINFPSNFESSPHVFSQVENNSEGTFSYALSNVSISGFNAEFSPRVEFPGVTLHVFATDVDDQDAFRIMSTSLSMGSSFQTVTYSPAFAQTPIVFGELICSATGENIYLHQISGLTTSNFKAIFSSGLSSNDYTFESLSWSGAESGVGYIYSTGRAPIYLGQVTDVCTNIYNLSGLTDSLVVTQFDIPITKPIYFTGITGSIDQATAQILTNVFVPVEYSIALNTGQTSVFTHNITYINDGTNFIRTNHTLVYSGSQVQPDPFTVFKVCFQVFGNKFTDYNYDSNYIYSFGMDGVRYLQELNNSDFSELYVFPSIHNKVNLNLDGTFDRGANEFFTSKTYTNDQLNIYLNGLGRFAGSLPFDYTMLGNYLSNTGFMVAEDKLVLDVISGHRRYRNVPDDYTISAGTAYISGFNSNGNGLYLDGVRLVSGVDYLDQGPDLKILNSFWNDVTGFIFTLPTDADQKLRYTGEFDAALVQRFAKGTSMLWGNGDRQNLDEQYVEISNLGLLTGNRNFNMGNYVIFNGDTLFWE